MRCEAAQRVLSEVMDEPPGGLTALEWVREAERHADGCPGCAQFRSGAWRVRELARLEPAPEVPDLAPAIMERLRRESGRGPLRRRLRAAGEGRPASRLGAIAGSMAAGLLVGFILASGGVIPRRPLDRAALASTIPQRLVNAAVALRGYQARLDITELHWTRAVPRRTFVADLAFRAPEDFRVAVHDTTSYPGPAWPRNDLSLVTNGRTWRAKGPDPCPRAMLPACPSAPPVARTVVGRPPFDPDTPMPTDLIVPMTVLAAADRVLVGGEGQIGGHAAVSVELSYQDASPLFASIQFLGSWRPMFPADRVVVWLDRSTWLPLAWRVYPAAGAERSTWASNQGLPHEPPRTAVLSASLRHVSTDPPAPSTFEPAATAPAQVDDEGFRDLPLDAATRRGAMAPRTLGSLDLVRLGTFSPSAARPYRQTVLAYASGLSWLTVARAQGWGLPSPFGLGPFAEPVTVSAHSVGYYEPATATVARHLGLHTAQGEFLITSNLPRATLVALTRSLPVRGLPLPEPWRVHRWKGGVEEEGLSVARAVREAGFPVLLPTSLPPGYRPAAAEIVRTLPATGRGFGTGVSLLYRKPQAELDGPGLLLFESPGQPMPPPTGADQIQVAVRGTSGRWSPVDHRLEWVDAGFYVSLTGRGLSLDAMLPVAGSLGAP